MSPTESQAPLDAGRIRRRIMLNGLALLAVGAVMTVGAVTLRDGTLGLLSLLTVFGALVWTSLRLVRHYAARLDRR